jgi:hypothetical protein
MRRLAALALAASAIVLPLVSVAPASAGSARPDIDEIQVSAVGDAVVFRIVYAKSVALPPTAVLDLFIDADDNRSTGDEGFDTAIDYGGDALGAAYVAMWHGTAEERPDGLRFVHDGQSSTFTVPVDALSFSSAFDYSFSFYAVIEVDGELADAAPTHVLVSPAAKPFDVEGSKLLAHEHLTFEDLADDTPAEDPLQLLYIGGAVFGIGGVLALVGWGYDRLVRDRRASSDPSGDAEA